MTYAVTLQGTIHDIRDAAREAYRLTCRTAFDESGFCLLRAEGVSNSVSLRETMVALVAEMSRLHVSENGETLAVTSATRFDQQVSGKPHLDAGPPQNFLVLGYEPSAVDSEITIFDYVKCAWDHGMSPDELMTRHNPMFPSGLEMLTPYAIVVEHFAAQQYQILCINNSQLPLTPERKNWLGTLHAAEVPSPDETQTRVINSTMVCPVSLAGPEALSDDELAEFTRTSSLRRRGYDRCHLEDEL